MLKITNAFTQLVGLAYILLAGLRLTPITTVNGKFMLYVGTAALLLIFFDLLEFIIEGFSTRRTLHWKIAFGGVRIVFLGCAIIAMVALPYIKINIPVKQVNAWGDAVTLAGLGFAIALIGLKHSRMQKRAMPNEVKNTGAELD